MIPSYQIPEKLGKQWKVIKEHLFKQAQDNENKNVSIILEIEFKSIIRIIERTHSILHNIFPFSKKIILRVFRDFKKNNKVIDYGELQRIGSSLLLHDKRSNEKTLALEFPSLILRNLSIKQLRFYCKGQNTKNPSFILALKNIKEKMFVPLKLIEEEMVEFKGLNHFINESFKLNKFIVGEQFQFDLKIDSLNFGEVDLCLSSASSFIVFLDQFLTSIEVSKIKSVSFKAKQQLNGDSLIKEYLFTFSKFLKRCSNLFQMQIIIDFDNEETASIGKMFSFILQSLSKTLKVIDLCFFNLKQQVDIQNLNIHSFSQERVATTNSISVRLSSNDIELMVSFKGNLFELVEKSMKQVLRQIKIEFEKQIDLTSHVSSLLKINSLLQLRSGRETFEALTQSFDNANSFKVESLTKTTNSLSQNKQICKVQRIEVMQLIEKEDLYQPWAELLNELFISCRKSLHTVVCQLIFSDSLNTQSLSASYPTRAGKASHQRSFEKMVVDLMQPINFIKMKSLSFPSLLYDVSYNDLLLKSLSVNNYIYFRLEGFLTIDKVKDSFFIELGRKTDSILKVLPQIKTKSLICQTQHPNKGICNQLQNIIATNITSKLQFLQIIIKEEIDPSIWQSFLEEANKIEKVDIIGVNHKIFLNKKTVTFFVNQINSQMLVLLNTLPLTIKPFKRSFLQINTTFQLMPFQKDEKILCNYEQVVFIIDISQIAFIHKPYRTSDICNLPNVYKIIIKGATAKKKQILCQVKRFAKLIDKKKRIDIFFKKNERKAMRINSVTKFINICQQFKKIQATSSIRKEIFESLLREYLL